MTAFISPVFETQSLFFLDLIHLLIGLLTYIAYAKDRSGGHLEDAKDSLQGRDPQSIPCHLDSYLQVR
jgi:hypothetical protein